MSKPVTRPRLMAAAALLLTAHVAGVAHASEGGGGPPPPPPPQQWVFNQLRAAPTALSVELTSNITKVGPNSVGDGTSMATGDTALAGIAFAQGYAMNSNPDGNAQVNAGFGFNITLTAANATAAAYILAHLAGVGTASGVANVAAVGEGAHGFIEIDTGGNGVAPFRNFYSCSPGNSPEDNVGCGNNNFLMPLQFHATANPFVFKSSFEGDGEAAVDGAVAGFAQFYVDPMISILGLDPADFNLLLGDGGVGNAILSDGVPEPASWALMLGGFGLMGVALRRRGRMAAAAGPATGGVFRGRRLRRRAPADVGE